MSNVSEGTSPAEPILQFFAYAHLPQHLQEVSIAKIEYRRAKRK